MIDLIVSYCANAVSELVELIVNAIAPILGFSFTTFNTTFPFALTAYGIFQRVALAIVLVISGVHLWPWFFPSDDREKISPIRIAYGAVVAVAFIYYGNYILEGIIDLCVYPYNAMLIADSTTGTLELSDFNRVTALIHDISYQTSLILYIILMLLIGIAFIKVLLEGVERYVILFLLVYSSPIAAAALASDATKGIYKKFFAMFISQCILLILNIWILKMFLSMCSNMSATASPILALVMGYSLLRLAQKMDSYLNQLGLNAAITGNGLGGELLASGLMLMNQLGGKSSGASGGGYNSHGGGGIGGFHKKASAFVGKMSPISGAADAMRNYGGAAIHTAGEAAGAVNTAAGRGGIIGAAIRSAKESMSPNTDVPKESPLSNAMKAGKQTWNEKIGENMHSATMKTRESSLGARAFGSRDLTQILDRASGRGESPLSTAEQADIANYSHVADAVYSEMSATGAEMTESANVAAVMDGIGVAQTDPAISEAVDVGYGNVEAENIAYALDGSGIHASYTKDGMTNTVAIVSASQYDAMENTEQNGFSGFQSGDGKRYYYRHDKQRAAAPPSEAKVRAEEFTASASAFAAAPQKAPLSASDYAYMGKHSETLNEVFDGLHESGAKVTDAKQVGYMLQSMPTPNIPPKEKSAAVNAMFAGESQSNSADGNGLNVVYESDSGEMHQITVLTNHKIEELGPQYIANRGYTTKNIGGQQYAFLYENNGEISDYDDPYGPDPQ